MSKPNVRHAVQLRLLLGAALVLLAAVVGAILLAVNRSATDNDVRAIQRLPAYSLTYPGAKLLAHVEAPSTIPHGGTRGALTVQVFGISSSADVDLGHVYVWYSQRLQDGGWRLDSSGAGAWTSTCYSLTMDPFLTEYHRQTRSAATPTGWAMQYMPIFEVAIERTCVP